MISSYLYHTLKIRDEQKKEFRPIFPKKIEYNFLAQIQGINKIIEMKYSRKIENCDKL